MAFRSDDDKKAYWRRNLNLMFSLLAIWALVSYGFGIVLRPLMDMIPVGGVWDLVFGLPNKVPFMCFSLL